MFDPIQAIKKLKDINNNLLKYNLDIDYETINYIIDQNLIKIKNLKEKYKIE